MKGTRCAKESAHDFTSALQGFIQVTVICEFVIRSRMYADDKYHCLTLTKRFGSTVVHIYIAHLAKSGHPASVERKRFS